MNTYLTLDKQLRSETDPAIIANLERKGWVPAPQPDYDPATQQCEWIDGMWVVSQIQPIFYTAEQWLDKEGYNSTALVTLLDLNGKLIAAGKSSVKLNAVKNWTDGMIASYAADPSPKSDWTNAPYGFTETTKEVVQILGS